MLRDTIYQERRSQTEHWPAPRPPLRPQQRRHQKGRLRVRLLIAAALCCGLIMSCGLASLPLYSQYIQQYHQDMAQAQQGLHQLEAAKTALKAFAGNPLETQQVAQAKQDFAQAYITFTQLNQDLQRFPAIVQLAPHYGALFSAATHIVPAAAALAQAGVIGCDAFQLFSSRALAFANPKAPVLTLADLNNITRDFSQVAQLVNTAADQLKQAQPDERGLTPSLQQELASFQQSLPALQQTLQSAGSLLTVAPALLGFGQPAHYLIEVMDSTELRPAGGFIGNYGILTLANGRESSLSITDVDLLDRPFEFAGHRISLPQVYSWFKVLIPTWSFRDSNLDANFATSASNGEQLYRQEGGSVSSFQGVIALTPFLIQNMLKITGPIYVPEYNETITADNLIDRIHYHQLDLEEGPDYTPDPNGHSSLRKRFTELLFEHFSARVQQDMSKDLPQFVHLLTESLATKDIQVYFNAPAAESFLERYHAAGAIEAPAGDSFLVVDANVNANKANYFIAPTMRDQVTLDAAGNATHHLTLTYSWPASPASFQNDYGRKYTYIDYVRVYVPPGSKLLSQSGWNPQGTGSAFGREVLSGYFTLQYGDTGSISLSWVVPGAATKGASGWHYQSLVQRQAGFTWQIDLQVTLPSCAAVVGKPVGFSTQRAQQAALNQMLTTDLNLGINYTCAH
ncbi:MAG TPA: DUF4012 domain-containing protein [Ktedonobacterales bacterium]|nr:DUF4012 domain-containing protein [Ktedonobacterales bacterium]